MLQICLPNEGELEASCRLVPYSLNGLAGVCMEQAYAAIGRAVFAAQMFETALIPIFEGFRMYTEPGYLEKTGGCLPAGAFKIPIKNVIKALAEKGSIASDLETRLSAYVEDRHLLIHRWLQERGWPVENDATGFIPIIELANRVEQEAKELARQLVGYMVKFAEPEWATANADEYKARMANIFRRAHLDSPP